MRLGPIAITLLGVGVAGGSVDAARGCLETQAVSSAEASVAPIVAMMVTASRTRARAC